VKIPRSARISGLVFVLTSAVTAAFLLQAQNERGAKGHPAEPVRRVDGTSVAPTPEGRIGADDKQDQMDESSVIFPSNVSESTRGVRPHPITPFHEARAKEWELKELFVSALAAGRHEEAQHLLHEATLALDGTTEGKAFAEVLEGYQLTLECTSVSDRNHELSASLVNRAKDYLSSHRLPPRRDVRRACLDRIPSRRR
jgi:hypothetical protein